MDAVFGHQNFRNEIVWRIGWISGFKTQKLGWIRNHETIFYYLKSDKAIGGFNKEYIPYRKDYVRRDGKKPTGKGIPIEDTWNCHSEDVLDSIMIKSFSTEKTGYPTQKPIALLKRIIRASSNEGDMVLDPFCGCATTCVAAEDLGRNWTGIDVSTRAAELVVSRIEDRQGLWREIVHRKDVLRRTDLSGRSRSLERTDRHSTASREETAPGAIPTSRRETWKSITSSPEQRAAPITWRICNSCAGPVTASRATGAWST